MFINSSSVKMVETEGHSKDLKSPIPITFQLGSKEYKGHFGIVMGGGHTSTFHLMDKNNYYLGRLRYSDFTNGWVFDPTPKTQELKGLADFFGDYIINWNQ